VLLAADEVTAEGVATLFSFVIGHRMAKAAVETAVLDAQLRAADTSFAGYFGAERTEVDCGVSVGISPTIAALLDEVSLYLAQGYRRIKLKIKPGWDLEPVAAVRELLGADALLQVDANTAYSVADIDHLAQLDPFDLLLIEQPFGEDDFLGHAELVKRISTPVCLDEAIRSLDHTKTALALNAAHIINIKPARVGGYLAAVKVHDFCAGLGVPVWCGGMLESGIGRAANLALASLSGFTLPGDISATKRYWSRDITEPFELVDGRIGVPTGPGFGVTVDTAFVEEITFERRELRPA